MKRYVAATIEVLLELEDEGCIEDLDGLACDGLSDTLRSLYPFIKDWAYTRFDSDPNNSRWTELPLKENEFEEGDFLALLK